MDTRWLLPKSRTRRRRYQDKRPGQKTARGDSGWDQATVKPESTGQVIEAPKGRILPQGLPFRNKKRSKDFSKTNPGPRTWKKPPNTYSEWISKLEECESYEDGFGREVVACSFLKWHRRQQKLILFTPSCDRPEDLFAFLSDFDESADVKYTLFAALLHELYTRGVNVEQIFLEGAHVLHYACYFGHIDIMWLLIEWKVDPNMVMPSSKMTALHIACGSHVIANEENDEKVIDFLLKNKADLNAVTEEGWTPLFKAIQAQKPKAVKHLLGKCEEDDLSMVQHEDNNGDTPLHLAAKINAFSIVREILEFAANADDVRKGAAKQDQSLVGRSSCFQLITAVNSCGITPIHYASLHGKPDVQDGILSSCLRGSNSAESDHPIPKSCLEEMIAHVGSESTQLIVWYTKEDKDGQSALDYAARARRKDTFHLLWSEVEKCTPVTVSSIGIQLNYLVKEAIRNPINWVVVDEYLEEVPKAFIHTILETGPVKKPNYTNLKSKRPPSPLSLCKVLTADPGIYKEEHLQVVKKFLDGTIFGNEVVVGTTFDADKEGVYDEDSVNRSLTLNALLCSDLPIWGHTAIKAWISNNMWKFVLLYLCFSLLFYLVFLGAVIGSLYLAARPDITEVQLAQQYIGAVTLTSQDMGRLFLEVIVLIYCFAIMVQIFYDLFVLRLKYFKLFAVYLKMSLIILLVILVVCRAAAIRGQWIVVSLLFLTAVCMSTEFLVLFNFSGTYVLALWVIIRRDVLKFFAIAVILTFAFSGGIYLSLRGDRPDVNITNNPALVCMNISKNDTGNINMTDCVSTEDLLIVTSNDQEIFSFNELLTRNFETVTTLDATIEYTTIFGVYSAILYIAFLMIILILMINALIAQISHSYDEAQDQASQLATYAKARFLMAVYPVLPIFGRNRQHERFCRWTPGYRRTPCCCGIMKSTKIIWINRSILEDSSVNPEWNCLKKIGRTLLSILQAIYAAEGDIVAKISDDDDKWKEIKKDLSEHVDALAEPIEKPETSTSYDADKKTDSPSKKATGENSTRKMANSGDSTTLEMDTSDGKRKAEPNTSLTSIASSKPTEVAVEIHGEHPHDSVEMQKIVGKVEETDDGDMEGPVQIMNENYNQLEHSV